MEAMCDSAVFPTVQHPRWRDQGADATRTDQNIVQVTRDDYGGNVLPEVKNGEAFRTILVRPKAQ